MRVLVIPVNEAFYAVPMEAVHQVLRHPQVTSVPLAPKGLIGVINVRGEIVPLLDTGVLTDTGALVSPPFAVLVSGEKDLVALAARDLPMTAEFETAVGPGGGTGEVGVYSSDGRLIVLLGIDELVNSRLDLKSAS